MKLRKTEPVASETEFTWRDYYELHMGAKAIEEAGGDPAEVARLRAEAEAIDVALRAQHKIELDYWRTHGVEHPRRLERQRKSGRSATWGPIGG